MHARVRSEEGAQEGECTALTFVKSPHPAQKIEKIENGASYMLEVRPCERKAEPKKQPASCWMSVDEAAAILGVPTVTFRRAIERNARKRPDGGIDAKIDGVTARKWGRLWRVLLDADWMKARS
jgi:hypothetical protein